MHGGAHDPVAQVQPLSSELKLLWPNRTSPTFGMSPQECDVSEAVLVTNAPYERELNDRPIGTPSHDAADRSQQLGQPAHLLAFGYLVQLGIGIAFKRIDRPAA